MGGRSERWLEAEHPSDDDEREEDAQKCHRHRVSPNGGEQRVEDRVVSGVVVRIHRAAPAR